MTNQNVAKSPIIPIASVLAILGFFPMFAYHLGYLEGTEKDEIIPLLIQLTLLIPAILGLWKFTNRAVNKWIIGGFVIYCLIILLGCYNVMNATDALATGLPMVVVAIPFSILFGIYLWTQLKKTA